MPHYVSLVRWTDQGVKDVANTPQRLVALRKMAEQLGAKLQIYSTMGEYDFVAIAEGPSAEGAVQLPPQPANAGNARTITTNAWTLEGTPKGIT